MGELVIPKLGDVPMEQEKHPFPEHVEPYDSDWWLDAKHKAVCDAYLGECFMDMVAAFKTQYTATTKASAQNGASRFFKRAKVRRYLYFKTRKLEKAVQLSQEQILRDMLEVKEMAMGRKSQPMVLGHSEGMPIEHTGKSTDLKTAAVVLTQLGKFHELGMWVEKKQSEVQVVNFNFDMGQEGTKGKVIDGESNPRD